MIGATFLAACVALAISELTAAFPRAGGEFVYAFAAFDRPRRTPLSVRSPSESMSASSPSTSRPLASFWPRWFRTWNPSRSTPIGGVDLPVPALGVVLMLIMLGLNWFGAQLAFSAQLILFLVMVGLGAIIVVVGFGHGESSNFFPAFAPRARTSPVR